MRHYRLLAACLAMLTLSACAPRTGPGEAAGQASEQAPQKPKSLTLALNGEPEHFVFDFGSRGFGGIGNADLMLAVHQSLTTYDDRGATLPMLAAQLPAQETGTWLVRPDGSMQTTYKLRPNITWQDGTPLRASDFGFGWTLVQDRDLPISGRLLADKVASLSFPDDTTLVIEWSKTYPLAAALTGADMPALPPHILEAPYRADKETFIIHPYWKRDFIGVGPYRLTEWEPGSHLVLRAYDGYYRGRAKIDTITVRFIPDENAIVANLLSGNVDGIIKNSINFEQSMFVKREWEKAGKQPLVIPQTTHWRMLAVQFRDPRPREMLDVRVRRGLILAIDRQALVNVALEGQSPVSHSFVPPDDARWDAIQDVMARYDYDPRRAQELLAEAGWRRTPDSATINPNATLTLETSSGALEQIGTISADYFKQIGLGVNLVVLSPGESRDTQRVSQFPSLMTTSIPLAFEHNLGRIYGPNCPTEQTRWTGLNSGCYQNPAHDRIIDTIGSTIDPARLRELWRDQVKHESEELPVLPLFFNVTISLFREGVTGSKGDTKPRTNMTWNVYEWDVQ
jgi:peptide/nickel transport system substrate-binding protein